MFDRDLSTVGILACGTSCQCCRAMPNTARKVTRDTPEPVRLAHRYPCRRQSVAWVPGWAAPLRKSQVLVVTRSAGAAACRTGPRAAGIFLRSP